MNPEWIWLIDPEAQRAQIFGATKGLVELVETLEGNVQRAIPPFTSLIDTSRWWVARPK